MKKMLCIFLSLLFAVTGLIGFGMTSSAAYKVGDILSYGSYPQSDVTASLGSTLNGLSGEWTSYGYSGASSMRYKDVVYNGLKYRGVTFDNYRPIFTNYSSGNNTQEDNDYIKGNVYWFKYEPLRWRVLDPSTGFIMCDTIIDAQTFNNSSSLTGVFYPNGSGESYYTCNYAVSDIRNWLNDDFYNTAFSATEKTAIKTTELENKSAFSSMYDAATTNDKVFLLSLDEVTNKAYGFSENAEKTDFQKLMEGTDYAKCQGLWVCRDEQSDCIDFSSWRLRTAYTPSFVCRVEQNGTVFTDDPVNHSNIGICPAIKIQHLNAIGLTGISVKTMPTKTTYTVGESFNQSGLTLTASYSDGSKKTVTSGFTCSGFNSTTAGTKTITVTYEGKTTTFTVTVVKKDEPQPKIVIHNYVANKTVDYKTTITFSADVTNPVSGASVHWFINGQDKGNKDNYTVKNATENFTVQAKYIKDGSTLAESGVEKVSVKTGFFAKLVAFFRSIFGKLPKIVQGFFAV